MRFSTIVAFMLPLAALAAPLAPRDRLSVRDQIVRGFDQARRGLRSAFRLANGLNIAQPTVVQLIQEVQIAEIKSALDVVIQQIDQGGAVGVSDVVTLQVRVEAAKTKVEPIIQGTSFVGFDNLEARAQEVQNSIREAREGFDQMLNGSSDVILKEVGIRQ